MLRKLKRAKQSKHRREIFRNYIYSFIYLLIDKNDLQTNSSKEFYKKISKPAISLSSIFLQILGCHKHRLHAFTNQQTCLSYDIFRLDSSSDSIAGTAIRLERSRLLATYRTTEMHGFTRCIISGE